MAQIIAGKQIISVKILSKAPLRRWKSIAELNQEMTPP
jgi:hypothetical protein